MDSSAAPLLPPSLRPVSTEPFTLADGRLVHVPKARPSFTSWRGEPFVNTFGGKPVLLHEGAPCFAELVILRHFLAAGWSGRWVETYGASSMRPRLLTDWNGQGLKAQAHIPIEDASVQTRLDDMAKANGETYSGCWDVVVWNGAQLLFVEAKRNRKDRVQATQRHWLESALASGLTVESFLVVEWTSA